GSQAKHAAWVGNPLRDDIVAVAPPSQRFADRTGPLRVLVVGGSLGAAALNDAIPLALAKIAQERRPSVVHQTGEQHIAAVCEAYARAGVTAECVPFIDDMAARYAWADLVVCRGGALTVAELAAVGLGAVIVPLPGAIADEQTANADFLVKAGAAVRIAQSELTPERLASLIRGMSRERALVMASAAYGVGRRDAADRVADVCAELGRRP